MDHPNIAKVLDAGLTPTGQPFFVMELVNGLPLNKFCDEMKLTPRERLEHFVPICQAVQHAHQKGIVHRDLKPANILVTIVDGKPVPKVIDFGVAKATSGKLTDESMSTQFGSVVGTLEYMSPEQAGFSGEDIDTRADIYSLGVILYELLTGLGPIDAKRLRTAALTEMIRIIREEEPSKPSTRLSTDELLPSLAALRQTEPRKLMRLLRGELDWVVMRCLEKHRERRYETASGLARDIQRYLADEAVEAPPPSARYRFGKFVRRHKGQVIAASLVLVAVLGGLGAVAAVQTAANAQLSRALARETKANEDVGAANAELKHSRAAVQARYELAVKAIKIFHTGVSDDFLLKQEQFKDVRDRLLKSASDFYGKLGALLGKPSEADAEYRKALTIDQRLADENPAVPEFRSDIATSHVGLGLLLWKASKSTEALIEYRKALAIQQELADANPKVTSYRDNAANTANNLSVVFRRLGRAAEARDLCERAVAVREALIKEHPITTGYRTGLAENYLNRGLARRTLGDHAGAGADIRRTVVLYDAVAPRQISQLFLSACTHAALAGLAGQAGAGLSAAEAMREADAAMALLKKAVSTGFRSADNFRTQDALDPLRGREDFKKMVEELEKPSPPAN